jgi:NADPH2:quinone reductase
VKQIPVPRTGEVLIKVECAPINPSDIYYMTG